MRLPTAAPLLIVCLLLSPAQATHPVEDHYYNPHIDAIDKRDIGEAWNAISELPPREAAGELRERFTPETTSTQQTRFQGVLHKDPRGVTIVKTVSSSVYTATITLSCREAPSGGVSVTRDVDFQLVNKPNAAAAALAARVQRELESAAYKAYFVEGRNKYARQIATEGQEAAQRSFDNDFQPPAIEGVTVEPRLVVVRDDCNINATVDGDGVRGSISVRAEGSVTNELVKSLLPAYDAHVWAEDLPPNMR